MTSVLVLDRSTSELSCTTLIRVNLMESTAVFASFSSTSQKQLMARVPEVSSSPLYRFWACSELISPVFRVVKTNTVTTTTKDVSTIAVSIPVIPRWSQTVPTCSTNTEFMRFLMDSSDEHRLLVKSITWTL